MDRPRSLRRNERGAILIQTAISLLMLMGFTVFVCDYGVVLVSRTQAQAAADAGALAGAVSLLFDVTDPDDAAQRENIAKPIAIATAQQNLVWNQVGGVTVSFPVCTQADQAGFCVQVNVYRNGLHGSNTLPVFFGPILGVDWQGAGAAARAQSGAANATQCMRPLAIPDLFTNNAPSAAPADVLFGAEDIYTRPDADNPGTGYTVPSYFGQELILKEAPAAGLQVGPGWFRLLDLVPGIHGDPKVPLRACRPNVFGINDNLTGKLHAGVGAGIVREAIEDLIALDPAATWDAGAKRVRNSCVENRSCQQFDARGNGPVADPAATVSPRVIVLPIFNPRAFTLEGTVRIMNFVAFFIVETMDGESGHEIRGVLLTKAGLLRSDKPAINEHSAFLKSVRLVR
jgi:Flp pilus assembly protein TadG